MLVTSNCACSHQRWYSLQQSLYIAFSCGRAKTTKRNVWMRIIENGEKRIRVNRAKILATTLNFGWILLQHTRITVALACRHFSLFKSLKAITFQWGGKCDGYMRMLQMNPPMNVNLGREKGKDKLTFLSLHFLKYDWRMRSDSAELSLTASFQPCGNGQPSANKKTCCEVYRTCCWTLVYRKLPVLKGVCHGCASLWNSTIANKLLSQYQNHSFVSNKYAS